MNVRVGSAVGGAVHPARSTRNARRRRALLAAALSGLLAGGSLAATAGVAQAAASAPKGQTAPTAQAGPTEIAAFPFAQPSALLQDRIVFAGSTGYLHQRTGVTGYLWTAYATGSTTPQPPLAGVDPAIVRSAGADRVAYQPRPGDPYTVVDLSAGTVQHYANFQQAPLLGVSADGQHLLVNGGSTPLVQLHADGSTSAQPITGLPTGAHVDDSSGLANVGADGTAVIAVSVPLPAQPSSRVVEYALLDMATGQATLIPWLDSTPKASVTVSGGYVVAVIKETAHPPYRVTLVRVADVLAGTAGATRPPTVVLADGTGGIRQATVLGDQLVLELGPGSSKAQAATVPLSAADTSGTPVTPTPLVARLSDDSDFNGDDGSFVRSATDLLVVGGQDGTTRGVQRVSAQAAGGVAAQQLADLVRPAAQFRPAGVTMAYGMARVFNAQDRLGAPETFTVDAHPLAAASTTGWQLGLADTRLSAHLAAGVVPCAEAADCLHAVDGNWYGALYTTSAAQGSVLNAIHDAYSSTLSTLVTPGNARVVDADGIYALVDGGSPAMQYLVDLGHQQAVASGPQHGGALWAGVYWHATGPGTVTASAEFNDATLRTVGTGAACTASEVQVAQHWLYWSCGSAGPAGVVDLNTGARIAVDGGPALLGDGYLVRHDAATGELRLTDVHSGQAAATPVVLGTALAGPSADDRGITWAVDRQSGDIAYAAADGKVHVTTSGVPGSALTATTTSAQNWVTPRRPEPYFNTWTLYATAQRPLSSWQLTVTRRVNGQLISTVSGGATPADLVASWNGRLASGAYAPSGAYGWKLTAVAADSAGAVPVVIGAGTVWVNSGQPGFRSYDQAGHTGLLAIKPFGESHWFLSDDSGRLGDQGWSENWNVGTSGSGRVNLVLPFGDLNGDGLNDLLTRDTAGRLSVHYGIGEPNFATGNAKTVLLGGGWNQYNALLSPGDFNGDGHDDLLARDASGRLWLYPGNGRGGFGARLLLGGGWNGYSKLVTVGDVTGDGAPDLLGLDGSGRLWRFRGNGHGGFAGARVLLGTGFGGYTTLLGVGDSAQDGRMDLVARDRAGVLWRYQFVGSGLLSGRVSLGGGWNRYSYLV